MPTFDVTLKGYDGWTDETDHLVKWVNAPDQEALDKWIEENGLRPFIQEPYDMETHRPYEKEDGVDVTVGEESDVDLDDWKRECTDPQVEKIKAKYEPKIIEMLNQMRKEFAEAGYTCTEPEEMVGNEEYTWSFICGPDAEGNWCDTSIGVDMRIVEQRYHEGAESPGITFRLDLGGNGGRIVGGLSPHNYTPEWVVDMFDDDAVEARFREVADNCCSGLLKCIEEYLSEYPNN